MPNNDIEVFDYVLADEETPVEIDYLTYAIFAYKKKQWIDHFKGRHNDTAPTQVEIDGWISELTDYDFRQMRSEAADFFHFSAEEHLADYIEQQKQEAVDRSILGQVKSFTNWWKHLALALSMAILAPVILGGLIFFAGLFDKSFPVHVTVTTLPTPQTAPEK